MFPNINYLLKLNSMRRGEVEDHRTWPWIMWCIWKSRNDLVFNSRRLDPTDIQRKAKEKADEWLLAQVVEEEEASEDAEVKVQGKRRWMPPKQGWLMCNVDFEWEKSISFSVWRGWYGTIEEWSYFTVGELSQTLAI